MNCAKILPEGAAVMTPGIAALGAEAVARIVKTVAVFDDFCHANDPHEEHDFGAFDADGHKVFFKIGTSTRASATTPPNVGCIGVDMPDMHPTNDAREPAQRRHRRVDNKSIDDMDFGMIRLMAVRKWRATASTLSSPAAGLRIASKMTRTGLENPVAV